MSPLARRLEPWICAAALCSSAAGQAPPCQLAQYAPDDLEAGDGFGRAVSLQGGRALIGARGDQDAGPSSGSAYVFRWTPGGWIQEDKLVPADLAEQDRFGTSVDLDLHTALVSSLRDDDAGEKSGSAYMFELAGHSWVEWQKLTPSDAAAGDEFGTNVALREGTAVIGAWRDDDNGFDSGSAYVFRRSAQGQWIETAKLLAPDGGPEDLFGWNVDLDGDDLAVSAYLSDSGGGDAGAVYLFEQGPLGWTFQQKLVPFDFATEDRFGSDLALSGDTLLVGAEGKDVVGPDSGAVYAYHRTESGFWVEVGKLFPADSAAGDFFGTAVDVEGDLAVIGARTVDGVALDTGAAYLFRLTPQGWTEELKFAPAGLQAGDEFGHFISLDESHVLLGARVSDSLFIDAGTAYLFGLDGACSFYGVPGKIDLSVGGSQLLELSAGAAQAGRPYLVLGTISGTKPGLLADGWKVPLNFDSYLALTLTSPSATLSGSFGVLDAAGEALVTFSLPAGLSPSLDGVTAHHAGVVFDPLAGAVAFASNAYRVRLFL